MLVLSRKVGERIWIGDEIAITVVRLTSGGVRIGIEAPKELAVVREELKQKIEAAEKLLKEQGLPGQTSLPEQSVVDQPVNGSTGFSKED